MDPDQNLQNLGLSRKERALEISHNMVAGRDDGKSKIDDCRTNVVSVGFAVAMGEI